MKSSKKQLIIGQGLAGSLLAMEFWEKGIEFEIVSNDLPYSASKVAAGILNPVTGKRLALSWKYGEFLHFAQRKYEQLEEKLGYKFFRAMKVLRIFQNQKEIEVYEKRRKQPKFSEWLGNRYEAGKWGKEVNDPLGSFEILGAAVLDTDRFVERLKSWLQSNGVLQEKTFEYEDLEVCPDEVVWGKKSFENAIFCEGFRIRENPWFQRCPLELAAGEIQTVSITANIPQGILNAGKWIRPLDSDKYLAGATYYWENLESPPDDLGQEEMMAGLRRMLHYSPPVLSRNTGVRPVIKDRKPILGSHPLHPQLKVFNGLGSKGSLMAPLLAKQLAEVLLIPEKKLDPEIDVRRFSKFFM